MTFSNGPRPLGIYLGHTLDEPGSYPAQSLPMLRRCPVGSARQIYNGSTVFLIVSSPSTPHALRIHLISFRWFGSFLEPGTCALLGVLVDSVPDFSKERGIRNVLTLNSDHQGRDKKRAWSMSLGAFTIHRCPEGHRCTIYPYCFCLQLSACTALHSYLQSPSTNYREVDTHISL